MEEDKTPANRGRNREVQRLEAELAAEEKKIQDTQKDISEQLSINMKKQQRLSRRQKRLHTFNQELSKINDMISQKQLVDTDKTVSASRKITIQNSVFKILLEYVDYVKGGEHVQANFVTDDEAIIETVGHMVDRHDYLNMKENLAKQRTKARLQNQHSTIDQQRMIAGVMISFDNTLVPQKIAASTTFANLAQTVSSTLHLPAEEVIFTDAPDGENGKIFLERQVVAAELYHWRTMKPVEDARLYVLLKQNMSVTAKLDPYLDRMENREETGDDE